jgi:hypothetical protein
MPFAVARAFRRAMSFPDRLCYCREERRIMSDRPPIQRDTGFCEHLLLALTLIAGHSPRDSIAGALGNPAGLQGVPQ